MSGWSPDELERIASADELEVAPARRDGTLRPATPIWVVRVGDDVYVRSWRGPDGAWFRAARARGHGHISAGGVKRSVAFVDAEDEVNDAVDAAYRDKYQQYPSYVPPMLAPQARETTLKLVPEELR
jgi:hypothetical protein